LLSIIPTVLLFFWNILIFLYGIIWHIWTVVVIGINIAYIFFKFNFYKSEPKNVISFIQTLFSFLIIPIPINYLITNS
jgi:hypothetical protein